MTASEFVAWIEKNAARVREYSNGGDGSNGKCDCIGLVVGAWRLSGNSWPWVHGSNYAARNLTNNLAEGQALRLGDLVYKARPPGASGYSLPERYKGGSDLMDYYHVGIVGCANPLQIIHCTSVPGGIKIDTSRGAWKYSGRFNKIQEETQMKTAIVHSDNGKPVNLRKGAGVTYSVICKVDVGTEVEIQGETNTGWAYVKAGERNGYMMTKFLTGETVGDLKERIYAKLIECRTVIEEALNILSDAG